MILNLALLLIIIFLLIFLSMIWPPDSPWWFTKREKIKDALKLAGVSKGDIVYDLGSGFGSVLRVAVREFESQGMGIELDPLRYYASKLLNRVSGLSDKIKIKKENFLESDISDATIIFVYLVPKALERLRPKFLKELKAGTRIVSIKYEMNLPLVKETPYLGEYKIRLYRTPKK